MNKDKLILQLKTAINQSFNSCLTFFLNNNITKEQRIQFFHNLTTKFYKKFSKIPMIHPVQIQEKLYKNYYFVPIEFKENEFFLMPHSFSYLFDKENDLNLLLKNSPILDELSDFLDNISIDLPLESYFEEFFRYLNKINLELRNRERKVLQKLIDPSFLLKTMNEKSRVLPPTVDELLRALYPRKKQFQTIKRALSILYYNRICKFKGYLINPIRIGYEFGYVSGNNFKFDNNYKKYVHWKFYFNDQIEYIFCYPTSIKKELFSDTPVETFSHWYWNINLDQYVSKKGWKHFRIPQFYLKTDIESKKTVQNLVMWDFNHCVENKIDTEDLEFLRQLSHIEFLTTNFSITYNRFGKDFVSSNQQKIIHLLDNKIIHFYPQLHHIGLDFNLIIKFDISNKTVLNNFLQRLTLFPESSTFLNQKNGMGLIHIKIPSISLGHIVDSIYKFKLKFPQEKIGLADLTLPIKYKINPQI